MTKEQLIADGFTTLNHGVKWYIKNPTGDVLSVPGKTPTTEDEAWNLVLTKVYNVEA